MQAQSQLPCARDNSHTQDSRTELWEETSTSTHLGAPRGRDQGFSSLHAAAQGLAVVNAQRMHVE